MRRAFLSLYLVIVFAALAFSWGSDRVWQYYLSGNNTQDMSKDREQYLRLLLNIAKGNSIKEIVSSIESYLGERSDSVKVNVFQINELAASDLKVRLDRGEIIPISHDSSFLSYYALLQDSEFVVEFVFPNDADKIGVIERLVFVAFYLVIAVAVYFWIWPLSRDLKRLKDGARNIMVPDAQADIRLSPRSAVYDLASVFNTMRNKITSLLASQKEMTHAMSHELRTPLARMKFSLASLESSLGERDQRILDLQENVSEMDVLISDFLNYARFEERSNELKFEQGNLAAMVERLIHNLNLEAKAVVDDSLRGEEVWCEWYLMEHCVRMILENAKRYARAQIHIGLRACDIGYEIAIEDDGPGVPEAERKSIFTAFYKSKSAGFGLGLALVQRMMTWHNGHVSCTSSDLGGAKFVLFWAKDTE